MRRALVEISARRLCLIVEQNGHIESSWSHALDQEDWPEVWNTALPEIASLLTEGVTKTNAFGLDALIFTDLPRFTRQVSSCPFSVSLAQAEESARLAAASVDDTSSAFHQVVVREIAQDDRGATSRQRHMLAVGASESDLGALVNLVSAAGLSPANVLGSDVPGTLEAIHAALAESASAVNATNAIASIAMSARSSILAVAMAGKLLCMRSLPIGVNVLAQAMTRPGRSPGPGEQRTLTLAEAEFVLSSVGVPTPEQEIPGLPGWTGARVLPQLQPVLQRISIEAKQAIRFSLPGTNRASVMLVVTGEGRSVPNLTESLARLLAAEAATPSERTDASIDAENRPSALLASALKHADRLPVLLPEPARRSRSARQLRSAVVAGAIAAAMLIGYEWWTATNSAQRTRTEASLLANGDMTDHSASEETTNAVQTCVALLGAQSRINAVLGQGADAAASMAMLAQCVPTGVTLKSVDFIVEPSLSRLTVRGIVPVTDAVNPSVAVKEFINGLEASPLVRGAKLGTTQRTTSQGRDVQSFDLTIDLVPLPQAHRYALEDSAQ